MLYSLVLADPTLWGRGDGAYQVDITSVPSGELVKCPIPFFSKKWPTFFSK